MWKLLAVLMFVVGEWLAIWSEVMMMYGQGYCGL
jgi:hypothetical protein